MKFKNISRVFLFILLYMVSILVVILAWKIVENFPLLIGQVLDTVSGYSIPLSLGAIASSIVYYLIIRRKG